MMIRNGGITFETPRESPMFCPHCGADAEFRGVSTFDTPGVVVVCTNCKASSSMKSATTYMFYRGEQNKTLTMEQAVEDVRTEWNARVQERLSCSEQEVIEVIRTSGTKGVSRIYEAINREQKNNKNTLKNKNLQRLYDSPDDEEGDDINA